MTHSIQKVSLVLASSLLAIGVGCAPPAAPAASPQPAVTSADAQPAASATNAQPAAPAPAKAYPKMAAVEQYMAKTPADEIALARTAAPPSISADAEVLVLGIHGYETAVKGKNGFVCFNQRAWAGGFEDPEFWNPRTRAPNCFNAEAARTELPQYLKRTEWVLAGVSKEDMIAKTKAAFADHSFKMPEPGAFSFMLSREGYLNDQAGGPWYPHVMFFVPHGQAAAWGAGLDGSPILGQEGTEFESTVLFIPVRKWSDGTPAMPQATQHTHN